VRYVTEEIVQGILDHDRMVLSYIYKEYFSYVKKYVKSNSGNDEDAWDVFQDAIGVVYDFLKHKGAGLSFSSSFSTFFYSVCYNIWQKRLRYRNVRRKLKGVLIEGLSETEWDFEGILRYNSQMRIYLKYLEMLTDDCKKTLELVRKGMDGNEIAHELGLNSAQVFYNKKRNCIKKIIELINNDPEYQNLNDYEKP
jgi:RNA polymerase sigma factor (sigma-70 family)